MTTHHPDLLDALEGSTVDRVTGVAWRQVLEPTAVLRPNQRGSRWNPTGVEALYMSLDADTAASEIQYMLDQQPVPIRRQRVTYAINTTLSRVADLREEPWAEPFTYAYDLNDAAACESIGAAAAWLGLGGLLVPSLRADGWNLVAYMASLHPDDLIEPREPYDYPPGPAAAVVAATAVLAPA